MSGGKPAFIRIILHVNGCTHKESVCDKRRHGKARKK